MIYDKRKPTNSRGMGVAFNENGKWYVSGFDGTVYRVTQGAPAAYEGKFNTYYEGDNDTLEANIWGRPC